MTKKDMIKMFEKEEHIGIIKLYCFACLVSNEFNYDDAFALKDKLLDVSLCDDEEHSIDLICYLMSQSVRNGYITAKEMCDAEPENLLNKLFEFEQ